MAFVRRIGQQGALTAADSTAVYHTLGQASPPRKPVHPVDRERERGKEKPGPCGPGSWQCEWKSAVSEASGDGPDPGPHQADAVEVGLLPRILLGPLARLPRRALGSSRPEHRADRDVVSHAQLLEGLDDLEGP